MARDELSDAGDGERRQLPRGQRRRRDRRTRRFRVLVRGQLDYLRATNGPQRVAHEGFQRCMTVELDRA